MLIRRKFLIFMVKVLVLIIIMASFWPFLTPSYNHALSGVANEVAPSSMSFKAEDSSIVIRSEHDSMAVNMSLHGLALQYGLVVLIALIVATPGLRIRQRLKFIAAALTIMFVLHVVALLVMGHVAQSISQEHQPTGGSPLEILFISIGFDLFPILVWAALSFRYWMPRPQVTGATKAPVRQKARGQGGSRKFWTGLGSSARMHPKRR